MLLPEEFFSLEGFTHRDLWKKEKPVWSALLSMDDYFKKISYQIEIEIPSSVYLENPEQISIGKGTTLDPGVFIQGPCLIGKNCSIRHGANLRSYCILGDQCTVGHASELKQSILLNGAAVTHLCYVGDSILGSHVNLGAGVKCANLRLDRSEVSVLYNDVKIKTGLKKLGAIIGDGAQIGCNCVLNPGTLIGKETISFPLLNLSGVIPACRKVKNKQQWVVEPIAEGILERLIK